MKFALERARELGKTHSFFYKGGMNSISRATFWRIKSTGKASLQSVKKLALLLDVPATNLVDESRRLKLPRVIKIAFMEDLDFRSRAKLAWMILSRGFRKTPSL